MACRSFFLSNQKACDSEPRALDHIVKFSSQGRPPTAAFQRASYLCNRLQLAKIRRQRVHHSVYNPDIYHDDHHDCSSPYMTSANQHETEDIQLGLGKWRFEKENEHSSQVILSGKSFANGDDISRGNFPHGDDHIKKEDMTNMEKLASTMSLPIANNNAGALRSRSAQQVCDEAIRMHLGLVGLLKQAWKCHHGSTFVLTISSQVMEGPYLDDICQDLSLLHGLGIKLVIIPGTHLQIDRLLCEKGHKPHYVGSYRVTDDAALEASMEVAGKFQLGIEAKLSSQPSIPVLRRHGDNDRWHVGVGVASGNFIAAKRRGVVDGIDFGATGEVKRLDVARIKKRLEDNCIVILSNLGYSSSGEVLNCNTYEVATACARELQADKLISLVNGPLVDENGRLIRFMTLQGADALIRKWAEQSETAANYVKAVAGIDYAKSLGLTNTSSSKMEHANNDGPNGDGPRSAHGLAIGGQERLSRDYGYLSELTAAVFVCRGGVQRVHLLDATIEGVLLLELYTRDGIGTMVASDRYEGTRTAEVGDLPKIEELLRPLEESGVLIKRSREQLLKEIGSFIVVERDASIIACGALFPYHKEKCAEVAALAVSSECRGNGQGDKLLDYMENKAIGMGMKNLFLLTTRTADWFVRRGFSQCSIDCIPKQRRARIDLARGSKYYLKTLISRSQN